MNVSQLIKVLQKIEESYGKCPVIFCESGDEGYRVEIESVEVCDTITLHSYDDLRKMLTKKHAKHFVRIMGDDI